MRWLPETARSIAALYLALYLALGCTAPTESRAPSLTAADQGFSDLSRQALSRTTMTPLFFGTEPDGRDATITAGTHFYAVSLPRDGHTLALHGVDQIHVAVEDESGADGTPPNSNDTVRGFAALVLVNEGIRSVAWEEDGAYWSLEIECERPFDDLRCSEDRYLLDEAEALIDLRSGR
jgi:hypothetical protein